MIDIDISRIKQCGNDIISLSNDLNQIIDDLYNRLVNIPTHTGEWQGKSADAFAKKVGAEKRQALELKNTLYTFGLALKENADSYKNEINNTIL